MSGDQTPAADAQGDPVKPKVDLAQTDELGRTRNARMMSIVAWVISAVVVIGGIIALIGTGQKIFILFILIGVLMPMNVVLYDNLILKPKIARLKKERQQQDADAPVQLQTEKEAGQ